MFAQAMMSTIAVMPMSRQQRRLDPAMQRALTARAVAHADRPSRGNVSSVLSLMPFWSFASTSLMIGL